MAKESWNADTIMKKSNPPPMKKASTPPLTEGKVVKGGRNQGPSQVKERPAAPDAIVPTKLMVRMTHVKDTKGTYVFASVDPDAPITTLYIRKSGMPDEVPDEVEVIVR